ncbi:hypothetical protein [Paenibacillus popilliae]|uniref:Restriction endonuclease n=1 Tax=Paenibacillus popilliae ATCC 14706 TaxID=1212764 RepID=M9LGL8_PAEPP|nr:hypothetical protein [Paenibacillus popilliae]GAC41705.1 restriction endonuclease [Paenibacillus popilliae ATCC 14706]
MLKQKFITGLFVSLSLLFVFFTSVSSSTKIDSVSPKFPSIAPCEDIKGEVSFEKDGSGKIVKKVIKVSDVEEYAKKMGITLPSPHVEIFHISPIMEMPTPANNSPHAKRWVGELYLKNVEGPREGCGQVMIRNSYYEYPGGSMSVFSENVQASYGGSASVPAEIISAAVNFNVSESFSVSDTQDVQIPYGKKANIKAYPMVNIWKFDVYEKDIFSDSYQQGTGWAEKLSGVCFSVIIY